MKIYAQTDRIENGSKTLFANIFTFALAAIIFAFELQNRTVNYPNIVALCGSIFILTLASITVSAAFVQRTILTPYIFFQGTTLVFLGGRFIGRILGIPGTIFSDANFTPLALNDNEAITLVISICFTQILIHLGYLLCIYCYNKGALRPIKGTPLPIMSVAALFIVLVSAVLGVAGIWKHYLSVKDIGYLAIYSDQSSDNLSRFSSLAQYGLLLGLGLSFAGKNLWVRWLALTFLGAYYATYLGFGLRGGFIAFALMAAWITHIKVYRLNFLSFGALLVALFVIAQLAVDVGFRSINLGNQGNVVISQNLSAPPYAGITSETIDLADTSALTSATERISTLSKKVGWFLHLQGSTLIYTGVALRITNYPATARVQSFIPGFSVLWQRVAPQTPSSDYYFPSFLAKSISHELFEQGYGVGWSLVADFYAISGGNALIRAALPLGFGFAFAFIFINSAFSPFFFGALVTIFGKIMLLPRAGLYSIVPYILAYSILFGLLYGASLLRKVGTPPRWIK